MEIKIVPLGPDHIEDAARLERLCFSAPWSADQIAETLSNPCAVYFAALCGEKLVGYAGMYSVGGEGGINNIAVDPGFRRSGVGTALLSGLIRAGTEAGLSRLCLEVRASNTAAVSLYEKNDFHRVGVRRGYYTAPKEDAVLFDKDL